MEGEHISMSGVNNHLQASEIGIYGDESEETNGNNEHGNHPHTQIEYIQNIWQAFSNVLCSDPGRTTVTEHRIDTG